MLIFNWTVQQIIKFYEKKYINYIKNILNSNILNSNILNSNILLFNYNNYLKNINIIIFYNLLNFQNETLYKLYICRKQNIASVNKTSLFKVYYTRQLNNPKSFYRYKQKKIYQTIWYKNKFFIKNHLKWCNPFHIGSMFWWSKNIRICLRKKNKKYIQFNNTLLKYIFLKNVNNRLLSEKKFKSIFYCIWWFFKINIFIKNQKFNFFFNSTKIYYILTIKHDIFKEKTYKKQYCYLLYLFISNYISNNLRFYTRNLCYSMRKSSITINLNQVILYKTKKLNYLWTRLFQINKLFLGLCYNLYIYRRYLINCSIFKKKYKYFGLKKYFISFLNWRSNNFLLKKYIYKNLILLLFQTKISLFYYMLQKFIYYKNTYKLIKINKTRVVRKSVNFIYSKVLKTYNLNYIYNNLRFTYYKILQRILLQNQKVHIIKKKKIRRRHNYMRKLSTFYKSTYFKLQNFIFTPEIQVHFIKLHFTSQKNEINNIHYFSNFSWIGLYVYINIIRKNTTGKIQTGFYNLQQNIFYTTEVFLKQYIEKIILNNLSLHFIWPQRQLIGVKRVLYWNLFKYLLYLNKIIKINKLAKGLATIIINMFITCDIFNFSKWCSTVMTMIQVKHHRRFLMQLNLAIKSSFYKQNTCLGIFIKIKGKIGVTGGAKRRQWKLICGKHSLGTRILKISYNTEIVYTAVGVLGCEFLLVY